MRRLLPLAADLALAANAAAAQTVVDRSAREIPPDDVRQIIAVLSNELTVPESAEIKDLSVAEGTWGYCGAVRTRDATGALTEFVPFYANLEAGAAYILSGALNPDRYEEVRIRIMVFGCLPG